MIVPVILSGGIGSRLWPLSRKLYPKQFIGLVNENSPFQESILRLPEYVEDPLIVCNEEHRFLVAEQLRNIESNNSGIILEPEGRNTAPAIALAALKLITYKEEDPTLLVLSSDHLIDDHSTFHKSIELAETLSSNGKLVALGATPSRAETGYGYIEVDNSSEKEHYQIISFKEKPNLEQSKSYLNSSNYFWNTGIFIFKASVYLKELETYEPEILESCKQSIDGCKKDLDFIRLNDQKFHKCPEKSIDYAVMEKTEEAFMVPLNCDWKDVGSWESLWEAKEKDKDNNVREGDIILNAVKNSYIHSSNKLITVSDLSDLVIIDTEDALLVANKNNSQELKLTLKQIENRKELSNNRKVYRPWGYFDSIDSGTNFQVKRIYVNPKSKISLQKHKARAEHWVVVKGIALITCGDDTFELKENQSTYIPKGTIHRLENTSDEPLEIIEIQSGEYLGEDDIVRLEDDYKRN